MIDCLFIAHDALELDQQPLYWQPLQGAPRSLWLSEAAQALGKRPVALIVPAHWVSACAITPATRQARWLAKAVQYAAEESFASDIEHLHLAYGKVASNGKLLVLAIARQHLQQCLERSKAAGLNIQAVYAEHDLLPPEEPCALITQKRALIGGSGDVRLSCSSADVPYLVQQHTMRTITSSEPYRLLARGQRHAINLAQGLFAPEQRSFSGKFWRPMAGILAVWFALQITFDLGQSWYLQRYGDALATANRALYQQLFPQDARIVNLRAQFDAHLNQHTQNDTRFLELLQHATQAIADTQLRVESIDYQENLDGLALQLRGNDFAELETLRQRLSHHGINAQLGSANREADGVSARLVIGAQA